ncbi:Transcriptional repressor smtB homolog [Arcanobacterium haemolyticum]|uniref:Transcriptional regulator, ArsR family n=1 Tax=Arcanobacterium haemolyticum (strain ATCC 9345 / DSM 20595 / CCM 5947 / CCUG 17215 / LMG 16163 / NBRC 15585 / NCTC 8452 / 11018) TaxID=644284 RepID=D7BL30_ARCHD|nr:transcriptional regulator, ArsR family [Arcanobacterium haemolyticum DSM 20595]SQH27771.1 Transcriptional repressor smtB homolog [Arcanobacterium haemolyticum]
MPSHTYIEKAQLLGAVADPIRLQILTQLTRYETLCVCKIETEPQIPSNLLSYHLRILREAGVVVGERRGKWIDYSLAPGALERLHATLPSATALKGTPCRCS